MIKVNNFPIADFHCDLLCYLQNSSKRSAYDSAVRCSIPQLRQGNVKVQTMAIFTETSPGSSQKGASQADFFYRLPQKYPDVFSIIKNWQAETPLIGILPAVENMSSFCEEEDDLDKTIHHLDKIQRKIGKFAYICLTWNTENRFGGGALSSTGLKNDGKRIIDYLSAKKIALDLSHASDRLAYDCLNYIDKKGIKVPLVASHSNFRVIANVPRNLPDDIAQEIIRREGVIGLNFYKPFVGESPLHFAYQVAHMFKLGGERNICFGADFFYDNDISLPYRKPPESLYFSSFDNAGAYHQLVHLLRKELGISDAHLHNLCYQNLIEFLEQKVYINF